MLRAPPLPRTFAAAMRDLGAEKASDRSAAVRDLTRYTDEARDQVVRALQKALRADAAGEVRAAAATALSDVGACEALPELLLAVEDDDPLVRQMAIATLGELGDPRATERLRRALSDDRAEVRFQAVMAFPRVSASLDASLEAILHATRDRDPLVCHIALRMTEELGDGPRGSADDARVIARAKALLDHASGQVRVVAAVLLASRGEPRDDPRVLKILARVASGDEKTSDREDEASAVELCGEIGIGAARAGLERRAFGGLFFRKDPLAWHARVALARMGHARACREILRELGDRDRDVRTLAVAAAGRARLVAARDRILAMRGNDSTADPHAVDEALSALGTADRGPKVGASAPA
jgi:HEAT repeat protein